MSCLSRARLYMYSCTGDGVSRSKVCVISSLRCLDSRQRASRWFRLSPKLWTHDFPCLTRQGRPETP
eukprot:1229759-Prymnesium_polylepis.1